MVRPCRFSFAGRLFGTVGSDIGLVHTFMRAWRFWTGAVHQQEGAARSDDTDETNDEHRFGNAN